MKKFLHICCIFFGIAFIVNASFFCSRSYAKLSPGLAGSLSLVPGLGQVTNGDTLEGLTWFATSVGLFFSGNSTLSQIGLDLWLYNMYDAYRDAGGAPSARYNVAENYIAFVNPLNIVDPIGAPVVASGAFAGRARGYPSLKNPSRIAMYGFVGLGEEGLFRGFLFPGFSNLFSSKWIGAIVSSSVFSVAHGLNGKSDLTLSPLLQRFIAGMLFSWQMNLNQFDLRNGIFAHAWYDILLDSRAEIRGIKIIVPF